MKFVKECLAHAEIVVLPRMKYGFLHISALQCFPLHCPTEHCRFDKLRSRSNYGEDFHDCKQDISSGYNVR